METAWENGTRKPCGAALRLLAVGRKHPEALPHSRPTSVFSPEPAIAREDAKEKKRRKTGRLSGFLSNIFLRVPPDPCGSKTFPGFSAGRIKSF